MHSVTRYRTADSANKPCKGSSLMMRPFLIESDRLKSVKILPIVPVKTIENGAGERNRTPDRLITNQLLYLLSYASLVQIGTCYNRPV